MVEPALLRVLLALCGGVWYNFTEKSMGAVEIWSFGNCQTLGRFWRKT